MQTVDNFKIKPALYTLQAKSSLLAYIPPKAPNMLNEEPSDPNRVYVANGNKYGQPKFRIKTRSGGGVTADSDAFWFTKDEGTGKIKLNSIIEIYRDEPDVHPLIPSNFGITLSFQSGPTKVSKPMTLTQSPLINAVNILQDLHTEVELAWDEIKDMIVGLTNNVPATFSLVVTSSLPWAQIAQAPQPQPQPRPQVQPRPLPQTIGDAFGRKQPFLNRRVAMMAEPMVMVNLVQAQPAQPPQPASGTIALNAEIIAQYSKEDNSVFGVFSDQFEIKELTWKSHSLTKNTGNYTINYRPTSSPDTFYFLPQEFRISVNEYSGEPKISIAMIPSAEGSDHPESYRIKLNIQVVPYFNPRAKKDLFTILDKESKGVIKYCDLRMGGYSAANFALRDAFAGDNAVFRGKVPEKIDKIDPVSGFTLTIDCSLESFDFLKKEIKDGFSIGDINFELPFENAQGPQVLTQPVPVYLDIRKLAGIPVEFGVIDTQESIKGFNLTNPNSFPIKIGGVEVTLLSEIKSTIYDADYEIGVQPPWVEDFGSKESKLVNLKTEDIDTLAEGSFWTNLVAEPYSISLTEDPDILLGKVIDYATGDPEVWELQINCPLFERWTDIDPETLKPYLQISRVEVEVRSPNSNTFSVNLTRTAPAGTVKMARSISQILNSQQLTGRSYEYRIGTHYVLDDPKWSQWITPESTSSNFLSVRPEKLA